ncbi:hypothetical protein L6452_01064 [Arctium lappa]|uniref:Uncharacterized protein n=1 Tax=Arctium lappa TaxID=4217 RepID=A0ACB9FF79_ARCLA|nr:hypothetical protein L6452_01064 [Arctium lappa]
MKRSKESPAIVPQSTNCRIRREIRSVVEPEQEAKVNVRVKLKIPSRNGDLKKKRLKSVNLETYAVKIFSYVEKRKAGPVVALDKVQSTRFSGGKPQDEIINDNREGLLNNGPLIDRLKGRRKEPAIRYNETALSAYLLYIASASFKELNLSLSFGLMSSSTFGIKNLVPSDDSKRSICASSSTGKIPK